MVIAFKDSGEVGYHLKELKKKIYKYISIVWSSNLLCTLKTIISSLLGQKADEYVSELHYYTICVRYNTHVI